MRCGVLTRLRFPTLCRRALGKTGRPRLKLEPVPCDCRKQCWSVPPSTFASIAFIFPGGPHMSVSRNQQRRNAAIMAAVGAAVGVSLGSSAMAGTTYYWGDNNNDHV